MILLQTRLCRKICIPQQIVPCKQICTRYRTSSTFHFTQQRYKATQSSPNSLPNYLKLQSKCHFTERDSLLGALLTRAKSVHYDVIGQDGTCSSCQRNFYNMDCISPETFRQFIEFQLDRPEHVGHGTFKTMPSDQIRKLLREDMLELEKLVTTIPHSRDIIAVIDQANIYRAKATCKGRKWCTQNRDKIVEVGLVNSPHTFSVLAYGAFEKTYSVNCRYFFKELDDLYCLYLSLLLPHMPVVYSMDKFSNFIADANEFELASGEKGFSGNFEKILSNVQSSSIPSGDREGFYFPSSSFIHFIKGGRSSCIRTTPFSESDLRAVEQLSNRNKAVEAANSLQTAIVENMEKLNPVVELAENQKESRNQAVLDWSSIDLKKALSEMVSKTVCAARKEEQLIEDKKHSFILSVVRDLGEGKIWSNEEELAKDLLEKFEVDPQELVKVEKIGQGGIAPFPIIIKVTLTNICSVQKVLKNAYHLRGYEDHYNSIFINPNRTKAQQAALQKLVQKMKKMIKMDPSKKWIIRDGKIVDIGSFRRKETNT